MTSRQLERLGYKDLVILQDQQLYKFTTDAVLLANIADNITGKKVADLCTGSGVIAILLAGKRNAKEVVGIELQHSLASMAKDSVILNNLLDSVKIVEGDVINVASQYNGYFDTVVCNPPYRKLGSGQQQANDHHAICRHEVTITLQQVIESGSRMLNNKGCLHIVHQSNRVAEICYLYKQYNIEPKVITPICSKVGSPPNLVIVKGVKGGNVDCILREPIYIYDNNGNYTPLVHSYYYSEEQ